MPTLASPVLHTPAYGMVGTWIGRARWPSRCVRYRGQPRELPGRHPAAGSIARLARSSQSRLSPYAGWLQPKSVGMESRVRKSGLHPVVAFWWRFRAFCRRELQLCTRALVDIGLLP